jgi:hypothetical protein
VGEARQNPEETRTPDRDAKGLFQPGNSVGKLGGRPPKFDFRTSVQAAAEADGVTPESYLQRGIKALMAKVDKQDVAAIKLLLDRMCELQKQTLDHEGGVSLQVVTGVPTQEPTDADD